MSNLHALIIGIDTYAPGSAVPTLRGCVNDARAIESMLRRQTGIVLATCRVLINEAATRTSVQNALDSLALEARSGDVVWIHYSGHGSKALYNDPAAPSKYIETQVLWESRTPGGRDLYDREFGTALAAIEAAGAQVLCFLDCCHAGGQTRDADAPAVRACTVDLRDADTPADGATVTNPLAPAPALQRAVILAACRDEEKAAELTPDGGGALWHGAATWYFLRTLDRVSTASSGQHTSGLTWERIHQELSAAVRTRYPNQTPQLLGPGNTLLFGGAGSAQPPALTVLQVTGEGAAQRIQVDGGAAIGINHGTRLAIFPADGASVRQYVSASDDNLLATATVDTVEVGTAWAVIEQASAPIPVPALAQVTAYGYGSARLKVAVLEDSIASALDNASPLFEVASAGDADLIVRKEGADLVVEDGAGNALGAALFAPVSESAEGLTETLEHYAIFRNVQRLSNLALSPALETALDVSAPVALKSSRSDRGAYAQSIPLLRDESGMWSVQEGAKIGVQIANRYTERLLITVLALNPDYSITKIAPISERQIKLDVGKSLLVDMIVPTPRFESRLLIKVLATVEPVSFASLLLDPLRAKPIRRDAPVRDAGALGWLLDALRRTGATPTRPAFTDPDDQWIALDIPFQITPQVSPSRTEPVE